MDTITNLLQGMLFAVKLLDYEVMQSYVLTIVATDQPTDSSNALSNSTQVNLLCNN